MWKVAVIGSLLVDIAVRIPRLPRLGDNLETHGFRMGAGGKGGNAAAALVRLGGSAMAIGCVGDDHLGQFQLAALQAEGIDTSGITAIADASTAVAIVLVESGGQNAVLVANPANELLTGALVEAALRSHWHELDALLVNFECARDAVETAVALGQQHRIPIIVDPAPARPHSGAVWGGATALTPNRSEAAALVGFELADMAGIRRAGRQIREAGPAAVAIKLGARGAYLLTDDEELLLPAMSVDVVDTTGAGDAFTAALVAALLADRSWADAVRYANAAGALATTRFGTIEAMPTHDEIEGLLLQGRYLG